MRRSLTIGRSVVLLAGALLVPGRAPAQTPAASPSTGCFAQPRAQRAARDTLARRDSAAAPAARAADAARGAPDVVLIASVSARSLRFGSEPRVSVRLCGGFDSVRVVERRNLPERVVPGVTYRDVHVAVEILGHIYAECLREAIGDTAARARMCPTSPDTTRAAPRRPR